MGALPQLQVQRLIFFKANSFKRRKNKQTRIRSSSDALDFARVCELNRLQDLSHWASKQYLSTPFGRHSSTVDLETVIEEKRKLVKSTRNVLTHSKMIAFISHIIKCSQ